MKYTIKDIAEMAGVSKATVSRVLNNSKPVSEDVKKRVMKVIEDTGFRPSAVARSLSNQETKMIGVVVPDISNKVFSKMLDGIEKRAHEEDYNVLLCNSRYDESIELKHLEVLREKEVDGIIICGDRFSEKVFEKLKTIHKPIVFIDYNIQEYDYPVVIIDNYQAAYDITAFLIEKGYKHIGMIHGPHIDASSGFERLQGYQQALGDFKVIDTKILYEGNFKISGGYEGCKSLIRSNPEMDALFCANDEMAIGALKACYDLGKKVPEDIAIVGFDNIDLASIFQPSLTTIHQPFEEKGLSAILLILNMINGIDVEKRIVHSYELIERESTK